VIGVAALAAVAVSVAGCGKSPSDSSDAAYVRLPDVRYDFKGEARAKLEAAGLRVQLKPVPSRDAGPGMVIDESGQPGSDTFLRGSLITLTVSTGRPRPQAAPSAGRSGCITTSGYGGLYSTVAVFNAHNPTTQGTQPLPGVAVYRVLSTSNGCVSAYAVDELTHPPQSASEIVFLTDGIGLPPDTTQSGSDGCVVYSSPTLTRASGFKYARATGTGQSGRTPAHAQISLTNSGSC
jgi:hypothetical protein